VGGGAGLRNFGGLGRRSVHRTAGKAVLQGSLQEKWGGMALVRRFRAEAVANAGPRFQCTSTVLGFCAYQPNQNARCAGQRGSN
jgi:hypothetical protein